RYSLAAYPYLTGTPAGAGGEFARAGDRRAALDLLVQLHRAKAGQPRAEDFVVPRLDALGPMMAEPREAWQGGPYARRAGHRGRPARPRAARPSSGRARPGAARRNPRPGAGRPWHDGAGPAGPGLPAGRRPWRTRRLRRPGCR